MMIDSVQGWNFSSLNMTNDDVTVLHVSVYYMRAYLSIKSDVEGRKSEWNGYYLIPLIYPIIYFKFSPHSSRVHLARVGALLARPTICQQTVPSFVNEALQLVREADAIVQNSR